MSFAQSPAPSLTPVSYVPLVDWPSSCPTETLGTAEMLGWNFIPFENLVALVPEEKPSEPVPVLPRVCTHDSCPLPSLAKQRIIASKPILVQEKSAEQEFEEVLDQLCGSGMELVDLFITYACEDRQTEPQTQASPQPAFTDQDYAQIYAAFAETTEQLSVWIDSGLDQLSEWSQDLPIDEPIFSHECNPLWLDSLVADLANEEPIDASDDAPAPAERLVEIRAQETTAAPAETDSLAQSGIKIDPKKKMVGAAPIVATIRESYLPYDLTAMDAPVWQTLPSCYQPLCLHDDFRPMTDVVIAQTQTKEPKPESPKEIAIPIQLIDVDWSEVTNLFSWLSDQWVTAQSLAEDLDVEGPVFRQAAESDEALLK
ncbi:MAG: hypothetical protein AAF664_13525 [Planctomycetota bacterium]